MTAHLLIKNLRALAHGILRAPQWAAVATDAADFLAQQEITMGLASKAIRLLEADVADRDVKLAALQKQLDVANAAPKLDADDTADVTGVFATHGLDANGNPVAPPAPPAAQ